MDRLAALGMLARSVGEGHAQGVAQGLHVLASRPAVAKLGPRHLQVEIITHCNLACTMCPRTVALTRAESAEAAAQWYRKLPLDRLLTLLDELPHVQTLSLHGIGEPLLHPQLFDMIGAVAKRGIRVRFTTNATLLDSLRSERLIASGLARLIVSLDGATAPTYETIRPGASFSRVVANLRELVRIRRRLKSRLLRIEANMVVQRCNAAEVPELVALTKALGLDGLILSPMIPPVGELEQHTCENEDWSDIVSQARTRARAVRLPLFVRGHRARVGHINAKPTHRCMHPWFSAVVTIDGEVMPCCNIHESAFTMGNTFHESFAEVWNGERYRYFRAEIQHKGQVPLPCRGCPDFS